MSIAQTILQQLGGNMFLVMTGAKNLIDTGNGLQFSLPSNFASRGINRVMVDLEDNDTYTVRFLKVRGIKFNKIEERELVYCEDLKKVFTETTGLDTTIGAIRRAS